MGPRPKLPVYGVFPMKSRVGEIFWCKDEFFHISLQNIMSMGFIRIEIEGTYVAIYEFSLRRSMYWDSLLISAITMGLLQVERLM